MTAVIGFALAFVLKPLAFVVAAVVALVLAIIIAAACYCVTAHCYGQLNAWSERLAYAWHGRYLILKLDQEEKLRTKGLRATGGALFALIVAVVLVGQYMASDAIWKALQEDQYLLTLAPALLGSALLVVARPLLHFAWTLFALDKDEWVYSKLREQELIRFEDPTATRKQRELFQDWLNSHEQKLRGRAARAIQVRQAQENYEFWKQF